MDSSIKYSRSIKLFTGAGAFWAVVATTLGLLNQLQLFIYAPAMETFGILRPAYTAALILGSGLSFSLGAGYYIIQKSDKVEMKFEPLGIISFVVLQLGVLLGILTILGGASTGREYGEMTFHSDNLIALSLLVFLISLLIGLNAVEKPSVIANVIVVGAAAGLAIYFLGNVGLPFSPLHSVPLQTGLQDASVQEFYRIGLLSFIILMPLFAVLYYFIPAYYELPLYSEKMGTFQTLGMLTMGVLAGAGGLVYSGAPVGIQTMGMFAALSLAMAVLIGGFNAHFTVSRARGNVRSDSYGLFLRAGVVFLILAAVMRALQAPRFMQGSVGYTWWNSLDISVDAQTYGLLILFGGAYILAQRLTGQTAYKSLAGWHLFLAVLGCALVLLSNLGHGIVESFVLSGSPDLAPASWTNTLLSGSFAEADKNGASLQYLFSLRGVNLLGHISIFLGILPGAFNVIMVFLKTGQPYEAVSLKSK